MNGFAEVLNLMVPVIDCLGLRVSEVTALKWEDINTEAEMITIRPNFTNGGLCILYLNFKD